METSSRPGMFWLKETKVFKVQVVPGIEPESELLRMLVPQ